MNALYRAGFAPSIVGTSKDVKKSAAILVAAKDVTILQPFGIYTPMGLRDDTLFCRALAMLVADCHICEKVISSF